MTKAETEQLLASTQAELAKAKALLEKIKEEWLRQAVKRSWVDENQESQIDLLEKTHQSPRLAFLAGQDAGVSRHARRFLGICFPDTKFEINPPSAGPRKLGHLPR